MLRYFENLLKALLKQGCLISVYIIWSAVNAIQRGTVFGLPLPNKSQYHEKALFSRMYYCRYAIG